jgi:hypothetical protein
MKRTLTNKEYNIKKLIIALSILTISGLANASVQQKNAAYLLGRTLTNIHGDTIVISKTGNVIIVDDEQIITGQLVASKNNDGVFSIEGKRPKNSLLLQAYSLNDEEANSESIKGVAGKPAHTLVMVFSALDPEGRTMDFAE